MWECDTELSELIEKTDESNDENFEIDDTKLNEMKIDPDSNETAINKIGVKYMKKSKWALSRIGCWSENWFLYPN